MAPLWLLPAIAMLLLAFAGSLALQRRLPKGRIARDGAVAVTAAAASLLAATCCYAIGALADGTTWRNAGAACLIAFPIVSTVFLRLAARKESFPTGSTVGALLSSTTGVALIGAWAILYLKGPRGGWEVAEISIPLFSAVLPFSGSACLGWWCGRSIWRKNA